SRAASGCSCVGRPSRSFGQVPADGDDEKKKDGCAHDRYADQRTADRMGDDDADEKHRRDARERERGPEVANMCRSRFDGVHLKIEPGRFTRVARLFIYLTSGGVSNVWYGAGDGTVHSSVSAPSHGLAGAFSPLPITHFSTAKRKISWGAPTRNDPSE